MKYTLPRKGDNFEDIFRMDKRYNTPAYVFMCNFVLCNLPAAKKNAQFDAHEVLNAFADELIDTFGPMSYCVLADWGVGSCEDVGNMMKNLARSGRIPPQKGGYSGYSGEYDFKEEFYLPYEYEEEDF